MGGVVVQDYLESYERITAADLASSALWLLAALSVWAGGWAGANRITRGDFHFTTHLAIASVAWCSLWILQETIGAAQFLLSFHEIPRAISFLGWGLLGTGVLFAHVSVFSQMTVLRRICACALAVLPVVAAVELTDYATSQHFDTQLRFSSKIVPFGTNWATTVSPSRYYSQLDTIREEVDQLAAEKGG